MKNYFKELFDQYAEECAHILSQDGLCYDEFCQFLTEELAEMECVTLDEMNGGSGVLYYLLTREKDCQICDVPVYGYWASSEKALSMLFCRLSEKVLQGGKALFRVRLYAHDTEAQRLFFMMQFGYISEKGVLRIRDAGWADQAPWTIGTLSKEQIRENWEQIWTMTQAIVRHLQKAPVFYPGEEFTQELYREFYLDSAVNVHAAFSPDGQMIGMVESNREKAWFIGCGHDSVNVGEAYVVPAYRGSGAAQALLRYAAAYEQELGAEYMWVEHGTANPHARAFWNKFFTTWQYELVRMIEGSIITE